MHLLYSHNQNTALKSASYKEQKEIFYRTFERWSVQAVAVPPAMILMQY